MKPDTVAHILLVSLGLIVLYVAWGNASGVLGLGDQCLPTKPEGLHFDSTYQLVYEDDLCSAHVYEYGRLVFVLLSALGLGAVTGGLHRIRQSELRQGLD
jgi:hypothetical protein